MTDSKSEAAVNKAEESKAEVAATVEEAGAAGYFGYKVDPVDNKEYSLESGPDSPHVVTDDSNPWRPRANTVPGAPKANK